MILEGIETPGKSLLCFLMFHVLWIPGFHFLPHIFLPGNASHSRLRARGLTPAYAARLSGFRLLNSPMPPVSDPVRASTFASA